MDARVEQWGLMLGATARSWELYVGTDSGFARAKAKALLRSRISEGRDKEVRVGRSGEEWKFESVPFDRAYCAMSYKKKVNRS